MEFEKAIEYVVWVKESEERSPWTIRDYKVRVQEFANFMAERGVERISEVETRDVREYIAEMDKRELENSTINIKLRYIRAFYNLLIGEKLTKENPMDGVKLRKERQGHIQPLGERYVEEILEQPDQRKFLGKRNYACMILMLGTGIRPSEMLGLHVDDWLDLHIIVREEVAKDRVQRILPMSSGLMRELFKYVQMRGDWGGKWLFPSQEGTRLSTHGLYQALKKYARRAGLDDKKITPYAFRHTFATNFLRAGGGEFKLQKILGHTSLAMTKRYVQISHRDLSEGIDDFSPAEKFLEKRKIKRRRS